MARPLIADRVKETTQTTGTGTLSLAGAATGFQSFVTAIGTGKQCYYAIVDDPTATTEWEVGLGTVTSGTPNTLSRDRVIKSSNAGSKVSWASGTKTVICADVSELLNTIIDTMDSDLVTAGTSTVYTLATNRPAVGLYEGRFVCAKMHVACGVTPTLNVDGEGGKTIKRWDGVAIAANDLALNAYYWFKYNVSDTTWRVFSPIGFLASSGGTLTGTLTMSGAAINAAKGSSIASASTIAIGAATGNLIDITGSITITAGDTIQAGAVRRLRFTDAAPPLLTHGGNFQLPGQANIQPAQYDQIELTSYGSGVWVCTGYLKYNGNPVSLPVASTIAIGAVEKATQAETNAGTADKYPSAAEIKARRFTSTGTAISVTTAIAFAHGLGLAPAEASYFVECTSADKSYSVGDRIHADGLDNSGGGTIGTIYSDSTNIGIRLNSTIRAYDKGGTTLSSLDTSKWSIFLWAKAN